MPEIVEFAVAANNRGLLELVAIAQPLPGEELHVGESSAVFLEWRLGGGDRWKPPTPTPSPAGRWRRAARHTRMAASGGNR